MAYINELKGRAGLLSAQIKLLAKISEELEPQIVGSVPLTPTEALLVNRLSEGPVHAVDLIESLYGASITYEAGLNRLKNLLYHFRKKSPASILLENGQIRRRSK